MNFRVEIPIYRGPLDLLLYLVRKHELDIVDIPIAQVTQQYLQYLDILKAMDVNSVADFLEMASTLIEIKSKLVLPQQEDLDEEAIDDPRDQLVERLLEYKRFKDAASLLEDHGRDWQRRFSRIADDLPPRKVDMADQPINEVELWDLVSALNRLLRDSKQAQPTNIVYDDTPIRVHMKQVHARIVSEGKVRFSTLFPPDAVKTRIIGIFLALLELIRHYNTLAHQDDDDQEIWITAGEGFQNEVHFEDVDEYEAGKPAPP
ncbi:segregation and condensation protein A [Blastopirellula marina]|uniref:Segregation and condensation protein A n=1 Tax=Blastopirellula marina TaxID=124 RepID=A0A2S8F549_9BACT|nr:segregation/condensation protein A [Blastopirellula marina]PQO27044.1 chromosome segregation protein ScpA [Blastopirellula marina]PTL41191.1 chromosome segregation protein ScpA [Blastopirellula marina]